MNSTSSIRASALQPRTRVRSKKTARFGALDIVSWLLIAASLVFVSGARATDPTWNYAVQLGVTTQASPAQITLNWVQDTTATPLSYTVSRKTPSASAWTSLATLPGTVTAWTDANVVAGTAYEYQVTKVASGYKGYGYVQAGIEVALTDSRGKVILLVDSTQGPKLATELARLQQDLAGDGWTVLRHDVSPADPVPQVKALIVADYNADPANVKAVFLFGRVPVPYAGRLAPDGHPDHVGAWPADLFYGDVDGSWTDDYVDYLQTTTADSTDSTRLTNRLKDGKYDQSGIASAVELQVGRVDLSNMPGRVNGVATFAGETELLRQYLEKDHNFRHRTTRVQRRGLVADYFGAMNGEAFAASGYRSFSPLVGAQNITNLNAQYGDGGGQWISTLAQNDYLVAYGCGPGWYQGMSGIGNTTDIVNNNIRAVFTLMCGSYLGDWDHEDNIMRSVLATRDYGLTAGWSGRPHWFLHPMGLGETIGYCARLTQNNGQGFYGNQINSSGGGVHVALMGDPTLRLLPLAPAGAVSGALSGSTAKIAWTTSTDAVLGYHVYRGTSASGPFVRITTAPVTNNSYTDTASATGLTYMVRAVKLEQTASGSYYNASQGVFWSTGGTLPAGYVLPAPVVVASAAVAPVVDLTAPAIALTSPGTGATLTGSVVVTVNATDNIGIAGVQFLVDGVAQGDEVKAAPYQLTWDTTKATNTTHQVAAVARDAAGNRTTSTAINVVVRNATPIAVNANGDAVWVDDALPAGALPTASAGGDLWTWVSGTPAALSGATAHQSNLAAGLHEHGFESAGVTLPVVVGDTLFVYVHLDPINPPKQIMLSWKSDNWEHRAYWGINKIDAGKQNTVSRQSMGKLPKAGEWVLLTVPAKDVGLEGQTVTGMMFSAFDGRATWDFAGKSGKR